MKTTLPFCALALGALPVPAARAAPTPEVPLSPIDVKIGLIGADYKKPALVGETFFNPFKVAGFTPIGSGDKKDVGAITDQSIADAVLRRQVTGFVLDPDAAKGRVIIGDEVFGVGDPVEFDEPGKEAATPLVVGATVVLRGVARDRLTFDVGPEGQTAHQLTVPLQKFWRQ